MAQYNDLKTLSVRTQDEILIITLNRPEVLNALNEQVLDDLNQVIDLMHEDVSVKGAILTGAGHKAFAAGADISEIQKLDTGQAFAFSQNGQAVFQKIEDSPKPIIAAVNGFALGGGCELAMSCHLRVASENAKFGQPEVNLGLIAGYGGTQRLPRLIGLGKATELLLTADIISASEALELRLVNYVVTQDELIEKASEILKKIFTKSPLAVAQTLAAIRKSGSPEGYETEAQAFENAALSSDGKEGTSAFLEKRKPIFKGK